MTLNLNAPVTVLFLIFLVLKMAGLVTWSWWIVTAPLWMPLTFLGLMTLLITNGIISGKISKSKN